MRIQHVIYASVLVAGLGVASPSFAQSHGPAPSSTTLDATLTAVKTQATGNNDQQLDHSSYSAATLSNMLNGSFNTTGSPVTNTTNTTNIAANQTLNATIGSDALSDPVDLASYSSGAGRPSRGGSSDSHNVGYQSGSNSINGNAFAAYAGIMNVAWNTGVDTNAQAATNIAAQGNVNFTNH
jgi:hypothetical protein